MNPKKDKAKLTITKMFMVNQLGSFYQRASPRPCSSHVNDQYCVSYDDKSVKYQGFRDGYIQSAGVNPHFVILQVFTRLVQELYVNLLH
jgi:hypothetical protein